MNFEVEVLAPTWTQKMDTSTIVSTTLLLSRYCSRGKNNHPASKKLNYCKWVLSRRLALAFYRCLAKFKGLLLLRGRFGARHSADCRDEQKLTMFFHRRASISHFTSNACHYILTTKHVSSLQLPIIYHYHHCQQTIVLMLLMCTWSTAIAQLNQYAQCCFRFQQGSCFDICSCHLPAVQPPATSQTPSEALFSQMFRPVRKGKWSRLLV